MPNPIGVNQLSPSGYGEKQAQESLLREAPISGAPTTATALNTPQRSQRRAISGSQPAPDGAGVPPPAPPTTPQAQVAAIWQTLASHPDASDLVKEYAMRLKSPDNQGAPANA